MYFVTGLVLQSTIGSQLLVVKRVISWPNLGHLFSSAHAGSRYEKIKLTVLGVLSQLFSYFGRMNGSYVLYSSLIQVVYADAYMLDDEMKWKVLPPMPKPNSHIECSWIIVNNSIIIAGGTTEKHPVNKRMILVGEVFQFHLDSLVYNIILSF